MLKNTANQYITFGLVNASDGSELTGASPSIYVTKDNGSQAAGAGTVTEKGNGQYHYAFTQAETNADMVGFLAIATGTVMVSFTIYPVDVSLFKADVAAALATYDPPTKAELDTAVAGVTVTGISSAAIDSILDEPITEPAGVFSWAGATLRNIVGWLGAINRNKLTQTSSVQTLRNDADDASIATADLSDDGTTATRGEWE